MSASYSKNVSIKLDKVFMTDTRVVDEMRVKARVKRVHIKPLKKSSKEEI